MPSGTLYPTSPSTLENSYLLRRWFQAHYETFEGIAVFMLPGTMPLHE